MRIIQLDKTFDIVLSNRDVEDVYFLRLTKFKTKSGSQNHQVSSKPVMSLRLWDIDKYLNDPDVVLVKIEVDK